MRWFDSLSLHSLGIKLGFGAGGCPESEPDSRQPAIQALISVHRPLPQAIAVSPRAGEGATKFEINVSDIPPVVVIGYAESVLVESIRQRWEMFCGFSKLGI